MEFVVDLCSFTIEAENLEEAYEIAIEMLETGEERPYIDKIICLDE